jgi:hypothetical protein
MEKSRPAVSAGRSIERSSDFRTLPSRLSTSVSLAGRVAGGGGTALDRGRWLEGPVVRRLALPLF